MNLNKILKQLPTGWAEEAEAMDEKQLRDMIVECNNNIRVTVQEMEENAGVKQAKEVYKEATAPFRDAKKAQNAKIAYGLHLLDEMGKI